MREPVLKLLWFDEHLLLPQTESLIKMLMYAEGDGCRHQSNKQTKKTHRMFTATVIPFLQGTGCQVVTRAGRVRVQGVDCPKRAPTGGPAILEQIKLEMVSTLLMEG